jgi:hypothetical protein
MNGVVMKLISQRLVTLASLVILVVLASAGTTSAQDARIQTGHLDALASKASQTINVNIDERLMQLTAKFLSSKDADEARVKEMVTGLKGIYVKSLTFETDGQYTPADAESIRAQVRNPPWNRIVDITSKKEGTVEVYLQINGSQIAGLAVLALRPKEITVVNIVGPVDLEKLTQIQGNFGVPDLDIERPKTKKKNE